MKITPRMRKIVGAALSEYPLDPETFSLEGLSKATLNVIERRCQEMLDEQRDRQENPRGGF